MSFTMEDFKRELTKKYFKNLSFEEQEELLQSLSPHERREIFKSLPPHERQEILKSLPPTEVLRSQSPEQIQEYLDQLNKGRQAAPRKPRRKK